MESLMGLVSIVVTVLGGLFWFAMKLSKLEGRLDTLEGKKHFERVEQELKRRLESVYATAKEKLDSKLNLQTILREIEVAKQDAEQSLVQIRKQQADLAQQHQAMIADISQLNGNVLQELSQEVVKLKQQVLQSSNWATTLAETLPEMSFETAFIDSDKNIQYETRQVRQLVEKLSDDVALEMIYIPGGTFVMGSNEADDEKPIHPVTLKPFFVGKYPVTQAQWEAVMCTNPSKFKGANRPVETVTWHDAMQFCAKLSQLMGNQYRLLSEAQWEYACRAGSVTKYSFGEMLLPALANYSDSKIGQTTGVGKYPANGFGLYDMHGNVWEWCEDIWHENYVGALNDASVWQTGDSSSRLLRGGSWYNGVDRLCCAYRSAGSASSRDNNWGLRLSRI